MNDFDQLALLVSKLKATSSSSEKKNILSQFPQCKDFLRYTYDRYKNYYITSDNIKKQKGALQGRGPDLFSRKPATSAQGTSYSTLFDLLDALNARKVTGHDAIRAISSFISKNPSYEELIYNIIDRDLKCRVDTKIINKVFPSLVPTFAVALANSFWDIQDRVDFKADAWLASRKLDGCRLLTIVDLAGKVTCYSRNGKEFSTLQRIKDEIKDVWPSLRGVVFDGEVCIVDENGDEHFDWVMKEINRKNHTISQPRYRVFDYLSLADFTLETSVHTLSKRLSLLDAMIEHSGKSDIIVPLIQTKLQSREQVDKLFQKSRDDGWEGLILRKDTTYQGKRSNDMLKVKAMLDAEYVVDGVEFGPFRYVQNGKEVEEIMLRTVQILHKGYKVGVGSGFTIEQRKYYYKHPDEIKGKTITVQYFEETKNQDGGVSLRFPVIKHIYDEKRDV
jgi:DNA ligase 1